MFKQFLLIGTIAFGAHAFAHAGHQHHENAADIYDLAAHEDFFLEGGPLPDGEQSYVLLPDGSRYPLDSRFWRATKKLEQLLEEDDPSWYPAPWQRLGDFVEEALTHHGLWVRLSAAGAEYWTRYGLVTLILSASGELIEHHLLPFSGACKIVQGICVGIGSHVQRFWQLIRYRFPIDRSVDQRLVLSSKQLHWNWKYWRAMKNIYTDTEKTPSVNPGHPMARYFLAREKIAFLEMQLNLAKEAIDRFADSHSWNYLKLSRQLALIGKSVDQYSIYLSGLAVFEQPIESSATEIVDKNFQKFFADFNTFLKTSQHGQLPVWNAPKELVWSITVLQKNGCEAELKPIGTFVHEEHHHPRHFEHSRSHSM